MTIAYPSRWPSVTRALPRKAAGAALAGIAICTVLLGGAETASATCVYTNPDAPLTLPNVGPTATTAGHGTVFTVQGTFTDPDAQDQGFTAIVHWGDTTTSTATVSGRAYTFNGNHTYALAGTYSVLAILAAALVASLRVLCFAEVGSRYAQTGGTYFFARRAFGSAVSFEVGLLDWFTLASSAWK